MNPTPGPPRELTCQELAEFVMDYLDGVLAAPDAAASESHLAECEDCYAYLRSYRNTVRLGKIYGGNDEAHPPDMPAELVQAILAARRLTPR